MAGESPSIAQKVCAAIGCRSPSAPESLGPTDPEESVDPTIGRLDSIKESLADARTEYVELLNRTRRFSFRTSFDAIRDLSPGQARYFEAMLELYQNRMKSQKNDHGLGVSVEELAEYCSVNRTTVLRYLHGRQRGSTRIGHLLKIVQPVRPGRGRKKLYHPNEALDGLARFLLMQNKVVAIIRDTYAELLECRLQDYHLLCQRYRQAQANVRVYQGGGHLKDLEDTVYELRNRRYEHLPSDFRRRLRADDEIVCRIAHYLEETYPEFTRIEEHTMSTIHDPRRWLEGVLIRFHEAVKVWTRVLQGLEEAQADLGMKTRSSKDPMTEFLSPVLFGFPEHIRLALNSLYSEISEWGFYREINLLPKQDLSLIYGHIEREYRAGRISRTTRDERRCLLATAWRQHLKSLARTQTVLSQIFH